MTRHRYGHLILMAEAVMAFVAEDYGSTVESMTSYIAPRADHEARQTAIYAAVKLTDLPSAPSRNNGMVWIARTFERDALTIRYNVKQVQDRMDVYPIYRDRVNRIMRTLTHQFAEQIRKSA